MAAGSRTILAKDHERVSTMGRLAFLCKKKKTRLKRSMVLQASPKKTTVGVATETVKVQFANM